MHQGRAVDQQVPDLRKLRIAPVPSLFLSPGAQTLPTAYQNKDFQIGHVPRMVPDDAVLYQKQQHLLHQTLASVAKVDCNPKVVPGPRPGAVDYWAGEWSRSDSVVAIHCTRILLRISEGKDGRS